MNQQCAAGSGSFFEQQATRLGLDVEAFARLSAAAPRGATIAGRCSVFAKSDMIHLQQKGTPVGEIAYGLCLAMARNFMATVIRGRQIVPPLALVGGGAANQGLVRAFAEVLGLDAGIAPYLAQPGRRGSGGGGLGGAGVRCDPRGAVGRYHGDARAGGGSGWKGSRVGRASGESHQERAKTQAVGLA